MTDIPTWSARHVAEYAYCPRLFYFMEVEGVFLASADTEAGKAAHRRVDRPSAEPEEDAERPQTIRSFALTSETLGVAATLDLAEIDGDAAIPVEYRKGRPRRVLPDAPEEDPDELEEPRLAALEPWPTDRVQVGLQAILLKEAGYRVPKAILYYAEERRRLEIAVDPALEAEALAVLADAKNAAQGPRPLPLLNDPKCVRCSLQPICLPDEIHHQRAYDAETAPSPRKIWPPMDDGIHLVAQADGVRIGVRGQALHITDRDGRKTKEIPLAGVESLSVLGHVQVTTQALHVLAEKGIPIAYLSAAGRMVAFVDPLDSVSATVQRAQVRACEDSARRLELAKALVRAKIRNQRTLLTRNHANLPPDVPDAMLSELDKAAKAADLDILRGHEGQAAAVYFAHFAGMFSGPCADEFDANGRQRRPPPDPINSCLSMGYSMLTHECVAALRTARLEPSIGAFHTSRPGRPALALDLMEPFRPLVADSLAVGAFNRGELTDGHFRRTAAGCVLTDSGRRAFFNAYARRMDTEITHPVFGYRLSYRRMIVLHARMISAWMVGDMESLEFLTTR